VALIAGTGFANAQGTGMSREGTSSGSTIQQSAPPSGNSAAPSNRDAVEPTGPSGMKATQSEQKPGAVKTQRAEDKDMKGEAREGRDRNKNAEQKGAADSKSQITTGQAGGGAKLSTEQRTKITTVIRGEHVQPTTNVNFSIAVGTRVPRTVSFHPLPAEVVTIYPQWRGYEFFLVNDQIIVVNPRTLEIVDVIDV
jgi:hypothetical protein